MGVSRETGTRNCRGRVVTRSPLSRPRTGRLPAKWWIGLPSEIVELVRLVETYSNRGLFILSEPDEKGYLWVRLCPGHPYASSKYGWQRLHRYLMMRRLGRVLRPWEHSHHKEGVPKDTTDPWGLELLEDVEHQRWHARNKMRRVPGDMRESWCLRDEATGRFVKMPKPSVSNKQAELAAGAHSSLTGIVARSSCSEGILDATERRLHGRL
jgi:hypothetical protein